MTIREIDDARRIFIPREQRDEASAIRFVFLSLFLRCQPERGVFRRRRTCCSLLT